MSFLSNTIKHRRFRIEMQNIENNPVQVLFKFVCSRYTNTKELMDGKPN